jgi:hypothetical protein
MDRTESLLVNQYALACADDDDSTGYLPHFRAKYVRDNDNYVNHV